MCLMFGLTRALYLNPTLNIPALLSLRGLDWAGRLGRTYNNTIALDTYNVFKSQMVLHHFFLAIHTSYNLTNYITSLSRH